MGTREEEWLRHGLGARAGGWLDAMPDPFACVDDDFSLVYVNHAFSTVTGCPIDSCTGKPLGEVQPFGDATERVLALLARARASGSAVEEELTWRSAAGVVHHHQVAVAADRAEGGRSHGFLLRARDVSQFRETERSLRDSQAEFRTLADNSPDNIIRYGLDGRATYCNQEIARRVDTTPGRIIGALPLEASPAGTLGVEEYQRAVFEALATGQPGRVEITVWQPGGGQATHSVLIRAERNASGEITGALAIGRDVTDLVRARQAAAEREREFRTLAENAGDQIARWDTGARYVYANPRMIDLAGLTADEIYGRTTMEVSRGRFTAASEAVDRVLAGGAAELVEQRFIDHRDGMEHIHQVLCVPERDDAGALIGVLGVGRDVTESVRQREELEKLARTDLLTGVPNSQALYDHAPAMLEVAGRRGRRVGVLLLDLDGFKAVNDTVGHAAGDRILRAVAERLSATVRSYDLLVRLGGDEFVIVIADLDATEHLVAICEKVLGSLSGFAHLPENLGARVGASIGVAVFPEDGATIEELVSHADAAMYQAKRSGRGRVEYFREELSVALQRRAAVERALAVPDLGDELVLHLQPVFGLGPVPRLAGAEALLRWRSSSLGMVQPDEFIPVAEETGLIAPIGRWVLQEAARVAARWNSSRPDGPPLVVALNVSTRQFVLDDIGAAVEETLATTGCRPDWLVLEITESLLLEDSSAVQATLGGLRERGLKIAVDDFGTGYSALHYLTRFPLDHLKIDRRFVSGVGQAREHDELVKALVALARALGLGVVAEGIETVEQLEFLTDQQCDLGQGFMLGMPVPVEEFEDAHHLWLAPGEPSSHG